MTSATAIAHPNIALIKYWGKADETLSLPATGSLSMTLDVFPTRTTVTVDDTARDTLQLNGRAATEGELARVTKFLDLVRELAGDTRPAAVVSENTVPTGAGLASSASGFAALATAAAATYGLDLDTRDLSRLARRGSGSASRSIPGGVAIWHAGDDAASFSETVAAPPLAMVIATVDAGEKPISSREAMRRTIATSPFFPAWIPSTAASLELMVAACAAGDVTRIGELTESNALRMHAVIQGSEPPIRYLTAASTRVFDAVAGMRAHGLEAYATADAGPNVVVLTRPEDAAAVAATLTAEAGIAEPVIALPGPGAYLVDGSEALR
ncbi:diphosphomevalonate decarboxylase [Schumannella soli]|uniref:diphosphomevalonate decarboxylase n=1 Tax=Schumannella soli TaxID=2590779 RepID=A0A506XWN9_9MICO|nr:diphosphomevalonate decarboxylase [Schumannella soli]TPW74092.1 diphosphomevalonate decarboxylase [Schumannella soli]